MRQTLDALEAGMITPVSQQHDLATFAPKINKSDSRIDWRLPAIEIDRRIRAMTPTPGAWTMIDVGAGDTSISIAPVINGRDIQLDPGAISLIDKRAFVGSATYALELSHVKPAGKKFMDATDWLRGLRGVSTEAVRFS
jgi:methionyl-tRNA formyltransferase